MEMQQVRYFVALARELNFTRAADCCNVTQPALTRAIQQLEHELGGPLFHRERCNTHLSELGRMMLPYFEAIEAQSHAARQQAAALRKLDQATLTIGAMCTIGPQVITDLIIRFRMAHPNVDVVVVDGSAAEITDQLERGGLEIAIVGVPDPLPRTIHQLPLFEEDFVILLPPNHRLCAKDAITIADLHDEPYVSRSNCEMLEPARQDLDRRGVRPRKVFSSPRDDWLQGMIKAGLGLGFFPELAVTDPDLVVRPLIDPGYTRTVVLATVRGRPHSPVVGAFVREARRHCWPMAQQAAE